MTAYNRENLLQECLMNMPWEEQFLEVNGLTFHVVLAGPPNGQPVMLLHGFPDFWWGWQNQIPALVDAGYRVIVPDQRGYNLSEKPKGISAYRLDLLAGDIAGLIERLGYPSVSLVGHDWGGVVAWATTVLHPDRVDRLAVLDAPYPPVFLRSSLGHPRQFLKSAYIYFFQLPWLPEAALRRNDFEGLANSLAKTAPPGVFTPERLAVFKDTWKQNNALTSMLNWYRALVRRPVFLPARPRLDLPVLILWGGRDFALGRELAEASASLCKDGELVIFDQANHWIQFEMADEVNRQLLRFMGRQPL